MITINRLYSALIIIITNISAADNDILSIVRYVTDVLPNIRYMRTA